MSVRAGLWAFVMVTGLTTGAWATRPTPHELLDQAMAPVESQFVQVHATDAERHDAHDLTARAEDVAARLVEARQHGDTALVAVLQQQMDLLGRIVRARIEAQRLEAGATTAEHDALVADENRVQSRAALERAAEELLAFEAQASAAPAPLPASSAPPAASDAPPPHVPARRTGGHR